MEETVDAHNMSAPIGEKEKPSTEETNNAEETDTTEDTAETVGDTRVEDAAVSEEVEEKPLLRREEEEEKFVEERVYTIPLRRAWVKPPNKRAPKAVRIVKDFIKQHMKVGLPSAEEDEEKEAGRIIVSNEVNEKIWSRGIEKPPRKIRVRAAKDEEGNVTVFPA